MGSNRKMHYKLGLTMPCLNGMKYCSLKWNAFSFYWVHLSSFLWFHGRTWRGPTQNLNIHQNQYDCSARYFMEIVISNAIVILNFILKNELEKGNVKNTFMGNDFCCIMRSVFLWRRCSHSSFVLFSWSTIIKYHIAKYCEATFFNIIAIMMIE